MNIQHFLFKEKIPFLNRALDAYSMRQAVISRNIANATTPNYKPQKVRFEELFLEQSDGTRILRTDENHFSLTSREASESGYEVAEKEIPPSEILFSGENSVNIDKEMSELAQNQIRFRFAARAIRSYFQELQSTISGILR